MRKFSLPLIVLSLSLVSVTPSMADVDPSERWADGKFEYRVQRTGNSIELTSTVPKIPRAAGIPNLVGTITGTSFTGKQYLVAEECPNLDGYVPAGGTVSADGNSITVAYNTTDFYDTTCVEKAGSESEVTLTFSKMSASKVSPTPILTSQPTQSDSSSYSPYCWNKHMNDEIAACSKTSLECGWACPQRDLKANSICLIACGETHRVCLKSASAAYRACIDAEKQDKQAEQNASIPNIKDPNTSTEKPPVGVSSKDFKALARANAQYQQAQAELDKLKAANDPRWEDKKDFASAQNAQLPPENDALDKGLEKIKETLERTRDGASVALDVKEFYDFSQNAKFGSYGGVSLITDVGSGVAKFSELVGKGVSIKDATTKSLIDTAAPSLFNLFPPLKGADMVATMPDRIMNTLGFDEKDPWRRNTKLVKDFAAPSSFVEKTTDAMIKTQNWTNVGGALAMGIDDIKSAEGFGEKLIETGKLVYITIGAAPVAVAMGIRDFLFGQPLGQATVSNVYNVLTYPE